MYVCICQGVTDQDIRVAAKHGAVELRDLAQQLGVVTCCGKCKSCVRRVLADCHEAHSADNCHVA